MLNSKDYGKYIRYAIVVAAIVAAYFVVPQAMRVFSPFIVAFIIAIPCQKLAKFLERKLKMPRALASILIVVLIILLLGSLVWYLVYQFVREMQTILLDIPNTIENLRYQILNSDFVLALPPEVSGFLYGLLAEIQENFVSIITPDMDGAIPAAWGFFTSLTSGLIYAMALILSAFFFIKDYDSIMKWISGSLPQSWLKNLRHFRKTVLSGFWIYIKAQLIIMSITFVIVTAGLFGLGTPHALVMAFFVALVDFIPVLGTGTILVPWAAILLITGDLFTGIGLLVLQVICFITRNIVQPKILSAQIGVHPLLTIISIFVGFTLFGVPGLIFGPLIAILAAEAYKSFVRQREEKEKQLELEGDLKEE